MEKLAIIYTIGFAVKDDAKEMAFFIAALKFRIDFHFQAYINLLIMIIISNRFAERE